MHGVLSEVCLNGMASLAQACADLSTHGICVCIVCACAAELLARREEDKPTDPVRSSRTAAPDMAAPHAGPAVEITAMLRAL